MFESRLRAILLWVLCLAIAVGSVHLRSMPSAMADEPVTYGCAGEGQPAGGSLERNLRCISGAPVRTRGYGVATCITDPRARQQRAVYYRGPQCLDPGSGNLQGEGIAQARAIAALNEGWELAGNVGVDPDFQWELDPGVTVAGKGVRIDISVRDTSSTTDQVGLLEVKGTWPGAGGSAAALTQVQGYEAAWNAAYPVHGAELYDAPDSLEGDQFTIDLQKNCEKYPGAVRRYHYTTALGPTGVLLVNREAERCPKREQQEADEEAAAEEAIGNGYHGYVGQDSNGNGNDDLVDYINDNSDALSDLVAVPEHLTGGPLTPEPVWVDLSAHVIVTLIIGAGLVSAAIFGANALALIITAVIAMSPETITALIITVAVITLLIQLDILPDGYNVYGDPHLITLDGLRYDLQAAGEFHLAEIPDHGIDIQGRFTPWHNSHSVSNMTSVAFTLDGTPIEIRGNGDLYIEGELIDPTMMEESGVNTLSQGYGIFYDDGRYIVVFPSGEILQADPRGYVNLALYVPEGTPTAGLLGDHNGSPQGDLVTSAGEVVAATNTAAVHGSYAESWRVNELNTLFTYEDGQDTETFTDPTFPGEISTIADFPPNLIEAASATCQGAGVASGPQFDDCVLDLLVTGDEDMATAAAATRDDLIDPLALGFNHTGALEESFAAPVAKNFAFSSYLNDPATSRVAGPIYDTPGYSAYVVDLPRHHGLQVSLDLVTYGPVETDSELQTVDVKVDGQIETTVAFDGSAATASGTSAISLLDTGTTQSGIPFTRYRLILDTVHVGTAAKIVLVPANFRGVLGTALGVNRVAMLLTTSDPEVFEVDVPFNEGTANGAGNLESTGAEDDYQFEMSSTGSVAATLSSCAVALTLVGPSGNSISPTEQTCRFARFDALAASNYVLKIRSSGGGPVTYGLSVASVEDLPPAELTIEGAPIGSTFQTGQNRELTFASPGGQLTLGVADTTMGPGDQHVTVTAADGTTLLNHASAKAGSKWVLPTQPGTYTVLLDPAGPSTGSTSLELTSIAALPNGQLTVDGGAVSSTFTPGQYRTLTFTADGSRLIVTVPSTTMGIDNQLVTITKPDGTDVVSRAPAQADSKWVLETTQAGQYEVLIDPNANKSGTTTIRVDHIATDAIQALTVDGPPGTTILSSGQNATMSFDSQGGRLLVAVSDTTLGVGDQKVTITTPSGSTLVNAASAKAGSKWVIESTVTGKYGVFVDPIGTTAGTTTLQVTTVADVPDRQLTVNGGGITSTLEPGQNRTLTFQAAGGRMLVAIPSTSIGVNDQNITITKPDGTKAVNAAASQAGSKWVLESTQVGTYRILVDPIATESGTTAVRVDTILADAAQPVSIDGPPMTTVFASGQNANVTFDSPGGRLLVALPETTLGTANQHVTITAPNGAKVVDAVAASAGYEWVIESAAAGTYTVFVDPIGTAEGLTTLEVTTVTDVLSGQLVVDGGEVSSTFKAGQNRALTFEADGGRVLVSVPSTTMGVDDQAVTITAPNGTVVVNAASTKTGSKWVLESTQVGTYQVFVDPKTVNAGTTGVRVDRVTDVPNGQLVVGGGEVSSTFGSGQNRTLTFDADGGRVLVTVPSTSMGIDNQTVTITAPNGTIVVNAATTKTGSKWILESTQVGSYQVFIDPKTTNAGTTAVRVDGVTDLPVGQLVIDGGEVASTFGAGQNRTLTFDADGGRLLVSVPSTSMGTNNQTVTITAPNGTVVVNAAAAKAGSKWVLESTQVGTYQVFVNPIATNSGTTSVRVDRVTDVATAALTVNGGAVTTTFTSGQNRTLTFAATGAGLSVTLSSTSMGAANQTVTITAPNGTNVVNAASASAGSKWILPSTQVGTYQVFVDPIGTNAGTAAVRVDTIP